MPEFDTSYCLVGHTHVPFVFLQRAAGGVDAGIAGEDSVLDLDDTRLIVNPGSVGQPRDGDPRASAMLIDTEAQTIEWRRVEYPFEKTQRLMAERGLPERLIQRLEFGL
jgi:diadenosine tetraphosphatase ApaH/serine/threonine PP2A family protein phosphatase